jgi:hypothetical protein
MDLALPALYAAQCVLPIPFRFIIKAMRAFSHE